MAPNVHFHFTRTTLRPPLPLPSHRKDCVTFLPKLVDAYKGFPEGKADVVFVSSDRTKVAQQLYMEQGIKSAQLVPVYVSFWMCPSARDPRLGALCSVFQWNCCRQWCQPLFVG